MYDLIIIGAGPAGLTAALYALRANKKVLLLDAQSYGGQIIYANRIENYPGIASVSGFDFITNLYKQVKNLGVEFKIETVTGIDKNKNVKTNKGEYSAKAIIIATGAQNRKLNLENEKKFIGKGISYCATCDGNFYKGKIVAVVGGGNTALEDAIYLSNLANKVYLIHRRTEFRGEERYLNELKYKKNVEFILNSQVEKINGNQFLESIDIIDNNKNIKTIEINGLFIAIGQEPRNEIFSNIVKLDESGYIVSEDSVHTSTNGIYVAGDTRNKQIRQLVTAVSDGAVSATVAIREMK